MPKSLELPKDQVWVRWICECCKKTGLFTVPKDGNGTWPADITLGIHRTTNLRCAIKDVTMRGGQDGVFEIVLERGKSSARNA